MSALTDVVRVVCAVLVISAATVVVGLIYAVARMVVEDTRDKLAERKAQQRWTEGERRTKGRL